MKRFWILALLPVLGCDQDENKRLQARVEQLQRDNLEIRRNLPSERPVIAKELETAIHRISLLQGEVGALRSSLEKANSQIPAELLPLASMIIDLRKRLAVLEISTSRKGHTHEYRDGEGSLLNRTTYGDGEK